MPSGSYLHAMRPDGTELRNLELPKACSPARFTRDGRVLTCFDVSDDVDLDQWNAVEREDKQWRRASMPAEPKLPDWARDYEEVDAPQWAPARDRIAFVRPDDGHHWFSSSGKVIVADADGSNERVVADDGEIPMWSPDGKRLAFARCRVLEDEWLEDEFAERTAECSLWTVPVDGTQPAELLVQKVDSTAFWSPDGRFIAFFRQAGARETFGRYRIFIAPSTGGDPQEVGPELVEPSVDASGLWSWPGLAWLPESAPVVVPAPEEARGDDFELQRCVDIWNRARMDPWPSGAANVSLVGDRCQVTLRYYGGVCMQSAELEFRFWCPSHGAGLHMLPPEYRVWNAHDERDGELRLFDPPKGPGLPLPKAPPHPMLEGYVIPYGKDGEPLADLKLTEAEGTCYGTGEPDGYPLAYPDGYPAQCWWHGPPRGGSKDCFKRPGRLAIGDIVLCPQAFWHQAYDPMRFVKVKVTMFEE
jgi:hypothetical protein